MGDLREYYGNALVMVRAESAKEAEEIMDIAFREGVFEIDPDQYGSILVDRIAFEPLDDPLVLDDWKSLDDGKYGNGKKQVRR